MAVTLIPLSIIGGIVSFLVTNGYIRKEHIDDKYCYYDITKSCLDSFELSQKISRNGIFVSRKSDFIHLHSYYQLLESCEVVSALNELYRIRSGSSYKIPVGDQVEILKYSDDSLMVKIRANIRKPTVSYKVEQNGYIPAYLLHDSK